MKADFRRIIRRPGPRKLLRWQVALHEAAHAVGFAVQCETWSQSRVWGRGDRGGVCHRGPHKSGVWASLVCTAAGQAAEGMWRWVPVPRGRPRRIRGPRRLATLIASDEVQTGRMIGVLNATIAPDVIAANVESDAINFVRAHRSEIIALADKLFLKGTAFLPAAKNKNCPVDVLPGEVVHVAACAAKGSSNVVT